MKTYTLTTIVASQNAVVINEDDLDDMPIEIGMFWLRGTYFSIPFHVYILLSDF